MGKLLTVLISSLVIFFPVGPAAAQSDLAPECSGLELKACEALAQDYLAGSDGVENDDAIALRLFSGLCERGLNWSCYKTAEIYDNGWGVPRSEENNATAAKYHERACHGGIARACTKAVGYYEMYQRDMVRAQRLARKGCLDGHVGACQSIDLDIMPMDDTDQAAIFSLYGDKCEAGDMEACVELGLIYKSSAFGYEFLQAADMYEKACTGGNAEGCWRAGRYYDSSSKNGDRLRALALNRRACDLGNENACDHLRKGFARAYGGCVERNEDIIRNCTSWGRHLWDGDGVPEDRAAAMVQFRRVCTLAAERNVENIESRYACHYVRKFGDEYPG